MRPSYLVFSLLAVVSGISASVIPDLRSYISLSHRYRAMRQKSGEWPFSGLSEDAVERALNDKPYFQGPKYK